MVLRQEMWLHKLSFNSSRTLEYLNWSHPTMLHKLSHSRVVLCTMCPLTHVQLHSWLTAMLIICGWFCMVTDHTPMDKLTLTNACFSTQAGQWTVPVHVYPANELSRPQTRNYNRWRPAVSEPRWPLQPPSASTNCWNVFQSLMDQTSRSDNAYLKLFSVMHGSEGVFVWKRFSTVTLAHCTSKGNVCMATEKTSDSPSCVCTGSPPASWWWSWLHMLCTAAQGTEHRGSSRHHHTALSAPLAMYHSTITVTHNLSNNNWKFIWSQCVLALSLGSLPLHLDTWPLDRSGREPSTTPTSQVDLIMT